MNPEQLTATIAEPYRCLSEFGYDFSNGLLFAWLSSGPKVQLEYDLNTDKGADDWTFWWISGGRQNYPGISNGVDRNILQALHLNHLQTLTLSKTLPLTPLLSLIYRHRKDLQQLIDINVAGGIDQLWRWWLSSGRSAFFDTENWLMTAEIEAVHRLDGFRLRKTSIAKPTALVMLAAANSHSLQAPPLTGTNTEIASLWASFLSSEAKMFGLPKRGLPSIPILESPMENSTQIPLPPSLAIVAMGRSDLEAAFGQGKDRASDLVYWWLTAGCRDFPDLREEIDRDLLLALHVNYLQREEIRGEAALTPLLTIIRDRRPDLQRLFDDATIEGREEMWLWWLSAGREELFGANASALELKRFDDELPPGLASIVRARPDLQAAFGRNKEGPVDLIYWWLTTGRSDHSDLRESIDRGLLRSLHLDYLSRESTTRKLALTPLLTGILNRRSDLQQLMDGNDNGVSKLWRWWFDNGRAELFGQLDWRSDPELQSLHQLEMHALGQGTVEPAEIHSVTSQYSSNGPRVCLVGYPKGEFGLGEDVRLLRAALDAAKISSITIDAPWPISARQMIDETSVNASAANFDCDVMFYVMPPFDTVTLLTKVGVSAFSARRKIGFWQWELDRFPIPAKLAMHLVDEIWCHSEHAAKAFRAATDIPVIKVPLPVFVPETKLVPRSFFDLPTDAFLVFTSFDGASSIARKNPLAAILSFQLAFPKGERDARLIVKAMNTQNDSLWRECLRVASIDERIVIIDDVMDRSTYFELLQNCDAVLSLHRAEGFGRLMAEAMALGIPVIASRYSGNLDYMTDENSWLIDGELIPLFPGDYAFHQQQHWLEPDIAEAAQALRECATNLPDRQRRAALGMQTVMEKYSLGTCGSTYLKLLDRGAIKQTGSA